MIPTRPWRQQLFFGTSRAPVLPPWRTFLTPSLVCLPLREPQALDLDPFPVPRPFANETTSIRRMSKPGRAVATCAKTSKVGGLCKFSFWRFLYSVHSSHHPLLFSYTSRRRAGRQFVILQQAKSRQRLVVFRKWHHRSSGYKVWNLEELEEWSSVTRAFSHALIIIHKSTKSTSDIVEHSHFIFRHHRLTTDQLIDSLSYALRDAGRL